MRATRVGLSVLAPLLVLVVLALGGLPGGILVLKALLGVLLVGVMSRRPDRALLLMLAYVPLQQLLLALLLAAGAPLAIVKGLGLVKELVVASLVVAAVQHGGRRRVDVVDVLGLVYVGLVTLYLLAPFALPGVFIDLPFSVRDIAWRADALMVVAFLAARRVPLPPRFLRTAGVVVTGVALLAGACALVEFLSPGTWSSFLIKTAHIRIYRALVFHDFRRPTDELTHILVGGRDVVRIGSIALSPLALSWYLLVPLAFCLERVSGRAGRGIHLATAGAVGLTLVATLTRSSLLGALVLTAITLHMGVKRLRPGRVQLGIALALGAVLIAPLAGSSTIADRASSTFSGDTSAAGHKSSSLAAVRDIAAKPLGRGLGTSPSVGQRFDVGARVTSENAYLQVGAELGVGTMVVFVLLVLALLRALRRRAALDPGGGTGASVLLAAGSGLALAGMFLHVWLDLPTALTFWSLAGAALGSHAVPTPAETSDARETATSAAGDG